MFVVERNLIISKASYFSIIHENLVQIYRYRYNGDTRFRLLLLLILGDKSLQLDLIVGTACIRWLVGTILHPWQYKQNIQSVG